MCSTCSQSHGTLIAEAELISVDTHLSAPEMEDCLWWLVQRHQQQRGNQLLVLRSNSFYWAAGERTADASIQRLSATSSILHFFVFIDCDGISQLRESVNRSEFFRLRCSDPPGKDSTCQPLRDGLHWGCWTEAFITSRLRSMKEDFFHVRDRSI